MNFWQKNHTKSTLFQAARLLSHILGDKSEALICEVFERCLFRVVHVEGASARFDVGAVVEDVKADDFVSSTTIRQVIKTSDDGRKMRIVAVPLLDADNKLIGAIVVYSDISEIVFVQNWLQNLSGVAPEARPDQCEDVGQLMDLVIDKASREIGKPAAFMNRAEKKRFIRFLDERGVFQIKKSPEKVARFLDVSKFTLYACLEEIRAENGNE